MFDFSLSAEMIWMSLAVFSLKTVELALGTIRQTLSTRGMRHPASVVAALQAGVSVLALSAVVFNLDSPWILLAYALGFATGTFLGTTLEQKLAFGYATIRVFLRSADPLYVASVLRAMGWSATVFEGSGRDGEVGLLFIVIPRKQVSEVLEMVTLAAPGAFWTVDESRGVRAGGALPARRKEKPLSEDLSKTHAGNARI